MKAVELEDLRQDPQQLIREIESGGNLVVVDGTRRLAEIRSVAAPPAASVPLPSSNPSVEIAHDFDRPMILVDDPAYRDHYENVEEAAPGEYLEWEGNLLVYTGPVGPELTDTSIVERTREERHRRILHGQGE